MARIRDKQTGDKIGTKNQTTIHTNDLIVFRIGARNGAMTIVPSELDGEVATTDFPVFEIDTKRFGGCCGRLRYPFYEEATDTESVAAAGRNAARKSTTAA